MHKIFIQSDAQESLNKIPNPSKQLIQDKIERLRTNPLIGKPLRKEWQTPRRKLNTPVPKGRRLVAGNYRIIYEVNDEGVTITKIGDRKDVYVI